MACDYTAKLCSTPESSACTARRVPRGYKLYRGNGFVRTRQLQKTRRARHLANRLSPLRESNQKFLSIKSKSVPRMQRRPRLSRAHVPPIRQQYSRLLRIRQIRLDHLAKHLFAQFHVPYMEHHLYALVNVPVHPVRAAQIQFGLPAVSKHKDPAVLQKSPNNAAHPNPVADPAHSRTQRARTAHDELNLHARLRSAVQRLNRFFV